MPKVWKRFFEVHWMSWKLKWKTYDSQGEGYESYTTQVGPFVFAKKKKDVAE